MMSFTDEQIDSAFSKAPQNIRDYIESGKLSTFMLNLVEKSIIHIDTAESVADTIQNMLIGLLKPDQFVSELRGLGLSQEISTSITTDVNENIFKPLRAAQQTQRNQAPSTPQPVARPAVQTPRPVAPQPAPALRPVSAPVVPQQPRPQAPQAVVRPQTPPQVRPAVSVPPEPKPTPPVFAPFPKAAPPPPQPAPVAPAPRTAEEITSTRPAIRTMMRDADQAQHPAPTPQPIAPSEPKPTAPPRIATAPVTTPSFNKTSTTPSPNAQELSDTLKKYGIDPYREPVE